MNEQRAQAYINLIEQLLACTDDEELNNILQANQELIDPQFLQVMENYATSLEEQGNNNHAAWLRDMAQQLGQFLNPILLSNIINNGCTSATEFCPRPIPIFKRNSNRLITLIRIKIGITLPPQFR